MGQLIYHRINITNKDSEIDYLKELENAAFFTLGIEVTDIDLEQHCSLSIDPQHSANNKITSIEYVFNYQNDLLDLIKPFEDIFMVTIKTDVDSIGAMALLTLLLESRFKLDGDVILRMKAIAKSDRHGRVNWRDRKEDYFHFENYNIYGLPSGLAYMASDHKISTEQKVKNMINYLIHGNFQNMYKYNNLVTRNLKRSNKATEIEVIVPKKLCFVESKHRGAISYGYRYTPVVIAKNQQFVFGKEYTKRFGTKYTIAQYEDSKHIDLDAVRQELLSLEEGWGGSSVIIGSPQGGPSELNDKTLIDIVKKHLY